MAEPHRIDVHHHILPKRWLDEEAERMAGRAMDFHAIAQWTPAMSLEAMDRNGIATTVTSISTVIVRPGEPDRAHGLARDCNEFAARLKQDHPKRFGMFALLPLPHVDLCLKEIEYAADVLRCDGFKMQTSYETQWLGDPAFAPVWDELNRRKATVFFHPTVPGCCTNLLPDLNPPLIEYPFDTTRAILSLVFGGTVQRCPDVKLIFAHGGGTIPMLAHRVSNLVKQRKDLAARMPDGAIAEFRKLYFDIVSATNPPGMAALMKLTTAAQLLFGTDVPYVKAESTVTDLTTLGLSAADIRLIESENAKRIMPSLR
ncbi:MAG TPA: amidohydrolase family protein [Stellaceae bacterium]|nr:amidohydrolase family protein [Stellaceae bacterium]